MCIRDRHYPDRAKRVLRAIRSVREGQLNNSDFQTRMLGTGPRAEIIRRRFLVACQKAGMAAGRRPIDLDCSQFVPPTLNDRQLGGRQLGLFE